MKKRSRVDNLVAPHRMVIAERRLEVSSRSSRRPVTVRFLRPELEAKPAGVWICVYEIRGLPGRRRIIRAVPGVDEVQALIGALQGVRQDLRVQQEDGVELTWEGQSDLGFPSLVEDEATTAEWRKGKYPPPRLSEFPIYPLPED